MFDYATVFRTAASDDATENWCARGVANICDKLHVGYTSGDAYTWKNTLPKNGWIKINVRPEDAPPGALLVYDRTTSDPNAKPGQRCGHIEMVAYNNKGERCYVSDKSRTHFGGSDPNRPLSVWINPNLTSTNPSQWPALNGTFAQQQAINVGIQSPKKDGSSDDALLTARKPSLSQDFNNSAPQIGPLIALMMIASLMSGDQDSMPSLQQTLQQTQAQSI